MAGFLDSLNMFDPAKLLWDDLSGHVLGVPPLPRSFHGFQANGGKLYIHGGNSYAGIVSVQQ